MAKAHTWTLFKKIDIFARMFQKFGQHKGCASIQFCVQLIIICKEAHHHELSEMWEHERQRIGHQRDTAESEASQHFLVDAYWLLVGAHQVAGLYDSGTVRQDFCAEEVQDQEPGALHVGVPKLRAYVESLTQKKSWRNPALFLCKGIDFLFDTIYNKCRTESEVKK